MESLALFATYILLAMLVIVLAVIVLSILVAIGKIPKAVGYGAVGVQTLLTGFTIQLTQMLFFISLSILLISVVLVFFGPASKRKS
jgi:hypothetical protein